MVVCEGAWRTGGTGGRPGPARHFRSARSPPPRRRRKKRENAAFVFVCSRPVPPPAFPTPLPSESKPRSHAGTVKLYGTFEDETAVYLVQEICARGDLFKKLIRNGGSLDERYVASEVVLPLLGTLAHLHASKVYHRDIKPENIFFMRDGGVRLGDFGLAIDARLERARSRVGTLDYMAPEVVSLPTADERRRLEASGQSVPEAQAYDDRVDVWAVGVLAYELLVGRPPFEVEDEQETRRRIVGDPALRFPGHVSGPAADFIRAALAKAAPLRPSARDLMGHRWLAPYAEARAAVAAREQQLQQQQEAAAAAAAATAAAQAQTTTAASHKHQQQQQTMLVDWGGSGAAPGQLPSPFQGVSAAAAAAAAGGGGGGGGIGIGGSKPAASPSQQQQQQHDGRIGAPGGMWSMQQQQQQQQQKQAPQHQQSAAAVFLDRHHGGRALGGEGHPPPPVFYSPQPPALMHASASACDLARLAADSPPPRLPASALQRLAPHASGGAQTPGPYGPPVGLGRKPVWNAGGSDDGRPPSFSAVVDTRMMMALGGVGLGSPGAGEQQPQQQPQQPQQPQQREGGGPTGASAAGGGGGGGGGGAAATLLRTAALASSRLGAAASSAAAAAAAAAVAAVTSPTAQQQQTKGPLESGMLHQHQQQEAGGTGAGAGAGAAAAGGGGSASPDSPTVAHGVKQRLKDYLRQQQI